MANREETLAPEKVDSHGGTCECPNGQIYDVGFLTGTTDLACVNGVSVKTASGKGENIQVTCGSLVCDYCSHDGTAAYSFCKAFELDVAGGFHVCQCFDEWEPNKQADQKCTVKSGTDAWANCMQADSETFKCKICKPGYKLQQSGVCVIAPCAAGCK